MIQSILDIILIIAYVIGFVINPLHREKRNGFSLCIVGIMLLIFWVGLAAGVYAFIGIPLALASINAAVAMANLPIWILVFVKKKITKPVWPKTDAVSLVIVVGFVLMCCVIQFGWKLNLTYGDIDPARYLNMAMSLIREQKVSREYLTDLINAWSILTCRPFLQPVSYYKAMILADVVMHMLSIWMFYILLAKINHGKAKLFNPFISILYFCGYQLYNLCYGAFFHWVNGTVIVMFLIYIVWLMEKDEISHIEGILCAGLGFFGILVCYPYFAVIVVPVFLPELIVWCAQNLKKMNHGVRVVLLLSALVVTMLGVFFAAQKIGNSFAGLLYYLQVEGLAYKEPYMDFIFFIPVFLCFIGLSHRHKKENHMLLRMGVCAIIFMCIWFLLMAAGYLSMYYYYRMYYVLWLIAWLTVGHTVYLLVQDKQFVFLVSYASFYVILGSLSVVGITKKISGINEELFDNNQQYRLLYPLYHANYNTMISERKNVLSDQEMDLCNYVIENLRDEQVPVIHSVYSNMQATWYPGIVGIDHEYGNYSLDEYSLLYLLSGFQGNEIQYFAIYKGDVYYKRYKEIIFDKFEPVFENEEGVIYTRPDAQWKLPLENNEVLSSAEKDLFSQIYAYYRGEYVPLLCERELYRKAEYYALYTGEESYDYWDMFTPETFISATYILNNNEVEYITILKDSEMYRENQQYFDAQYIVYENDAGMIVRHAGTGWMPSEQEG